MKEQAIRVLLLALIFVGVPLLPTGARADSLVFIDCASYVRLESWDHSYLDARTLDGVAKFKLRANCNLFEETPSMNSPSAPTEVRVLGRDPNTEVIGWYEDGRVMQLVNVKVGGETHHFDIRLSNCPKNPYIAWDSGPVTCGGAPDLFFSRPGDTLKSRTFFFGNLGQPRQYPVGRGVVKEGQARLAVLNTTAQGRVFRFVRMVPAHISVPLGQRNALPPTFEMKLVYDGMPPTKIQFWSESDPIPLTPVQTSLSRFGSEQYVAMMLPSSVITSRTSSIKFDMQFDSAGMHSAGTYTAAVVELPGVKFADEQFSNTGAGRQALPRESAALRGDVTAKPKPRSITVPPLPLPSHSVPTRAARIAVPQGTAQLNVPAPLQRATGTPPGHAQVSPRRAMGTDPSAYRSLPTSGAQQCKAACGGDAQCKAWSWVKPGAEGQGTCTLTSRVPQVSKADCCESGVK